MSAQQQACSAKLSDHNQQVLRILGAAGRDAAVCRAGPSRETTLLHRPTHLLRQLRRQAAPLFVQHLEELR